MRTIGGFLVLFVVAAAGCSSGRDPDPPDAASDADVPVVDADDASPDSASDSDVDEDGGRDADTGTIDADTDRPDADEPTDADGDNDGSADADMGGDADAGPLTVEACFEDDFLFDSPILLDYDRFGPTVGSHCLGTNHQDIVGVERVVFLGDSVTVGTPPTLATEYYRSQLADRLAAHFGLRPPGALWKRVNILDGTSLVRTAGDFSSCAEWGARTDDLMRDGTQVLDCFPESQRHKTTLVIMTMGGNDISSITQAGIDGVPIPDIWDEVHEFVGLMRDTITWLYEDPARFPGGVYVVFANMFEFTDGTGDVSACPAAGLAGFGAEWADPDALADMVIWANEQYLSIAVDTGTDMVFMLEHFCGHGFNSNDPTTPCYRGPGTPCWFDVTCIHPNGMGHGQIADLFMATVLE